MGTTLWFPFPQFLGNNGGEFITPITDGFITDLNSSFEKQFFDVTVTQSEAMIESDCVLNDALVETVVIRLHVSKHGRPANPNLT